jgi:hypothetical protein
MRKTTGSLALLLFFVLAGTATAKHLRFLGPHPIAAKYGGGYCYIEAPHIHPYPPDHPNLYHDEGGQLVFTADPTPFGYDGPKFTFYGHHPIAGAPGAICYMEGPHYHSYAPPEEPGYKVDNGVAFYVGTFPPAYYKEGPHRAKLVAADYRPYATLRPTVTVAPPPEWHPEPWVHVNAPGVVVAPPGVEVNAPGVVVAPPSVEVHAPGVYVAPPPRVEVHAPGVVVAPPGVVVEGPRPVIVGPPHPPHPHVFVGGPPPVVVGAPGVVVGAPGVVVEERVEYGHGHGHGHAYGHYKHGH